MVRGVSGASWVVFTLGTACWSAPAAAAKPGEAFRLEYWAEGRCPDAVEFARQIQTRAPRLRPAEADEPALGFYAELVERGGSASGRLTARSPDGREVVREVRGPTCDDVATALALIAALAADPNQSLEAPTARPSSAPPRPTERVSDDALPPTELPAPDPASRWTYGVGAGLAFDSSIAPSPGYGLGIAFDAEAPGGSAVRPLVALSATRAAASNTETGGGSGSFTWLAFRVAGCPVRWPEETPLFFRPCAFVDAGILDGDVALGSQSRDQSKTWLSSGGFGRIEALVAEVVSFQLDGGITVPLLRPTFDAGDGARQAFKVPASGILGRIGLSYRFQ